MTLRSLLIASIAVSTSAQTVSSLLGFLSHDSFSNASESIDDINLYTSPSRPRSYVVGIRFKAAGDNLCYGALIAPKYVVTSDCKQTSDLRIVHRALDSFLDVQLYVPRDKNVVTIGSLFNGGVHADGSETLRIKNWPTYPNYDSSGYMAVVVYELEKASSFQPVALPSTIPVSLTNGVKLTTFGWANNGSANVIVETTVQYRDLDHCDRSSTWFKDCVCALVSTASDPCNVVRGSPLIWTQNCQDTLVGMRFLKKKDACGQTDVAMAYTSFKSVLSWVKAKAHI